MDLLQAVLLEVIEGITESLPVSSTGHLIVVRAWLGIGQDKAQTAFDIIIQLAAILAVVANYGAKKKRDRPGLLSSWDVCLDWHKTFSPRPFRGLHIE